MNKDEIYWINFNYFLMVYGDEGSAHSATANELGYEPKNDEHYELERES